MGSSRLHSPIPHKSIVPGIAWPALPQAAGQALLAQMFMLERSQWLSATHLADRQFTQLRRLVRHATSQVPHYRDHMRRAQIFTVAGLTPESFLRWPILDRANVLAERENLRARQVPPEHGGLINSSSTGSTGHPVTVLSTEVAGFLHAAIVTRSHLWYGLDFRAKFASIRRGVQNATYPDWGAPLRDAVSTGPLVTRELMEETPRQLDWLCRESAAYLLSMGNNLRALLLESSASGRIPEGLRALLSYAVTLPADLRSLAREVWNVPVFDTYSCMELGPLALQCPSHEHLHIQSERVLLEILREDGTPSEPGETGRVVATDLHNFAMPMIRYALGDYAEVGDACPCGRGLPVIRRVAGRHINAAVDPTGRRFWPVIRPERWLETVQITQRQMVQRTPSLIEVRYVFERDLEASEKADLAASLNESLRYRFDYAFVRVPSIDPAPGEKFEEFISLIRST